MKRLGFVVAVFSAAMIAFAAPPSLAQDQSVGAVVRDMVFSEVERRIINEHFGVDAAQQPTGTQTGMPEWAVRDDDDDREYDDDDGQDGQGQGQDKGKNKNKGKGKGNAKGGSKQLPPGLAKRDTLPPGLARQYEQNGRLPAGLAKRDLPDDLASKLPARLDTQEVTVVDDDVVLIDKATGVILDILRDVVTNGGATTQPADGTLADPGPRTDADRGANEDTMLDTVLKSIFGGRAD